MTIEDGDVEVTIELTQNHEQVILGTSDVGNNYFYPLEAVELGRALIEEAMKLIDFPESTVIVQDIRAWTIGKAVILDEEI